jgi:hypothetical protein
MNLRIIIILIFILPGVALHARDKTDVMVMNNGDRMTCEVKALERGVLYVDFDYIDGTVAVNWSKVARLESNRLFYVKTEDGSVHTGTLSTPETGAGRPVEIHVVEAPQQEVVIERSHIVRMTPTSERFWQRFDGEVNLGLIYSKGNQSTQFSLGSTTEYVRERWNAYATYDSNLSSSTGANVSTRNFVALNARHLLPWNHWFYSGLANFLQSSEQGIGLQSTYGGGIGRYLTSSDRASVAVFGGVAWQRTSYNQPRLQATEQNVTSALFWAQAKVFKFSKTDLEVTGTLLPALSDPGRLRFNTDASYYIKLVSNLKWNFSFYGNWDNRPPPGFASSDYGTSSGISWTFGPK